MIVSRCVSTRVVALGVRLIPRTILVTRASDRPKALGYSM